MAAHGPFAGVIFDLDGTLVDSVPMSLSILNAMLEERGSARRITYEAALPFASFGGLALVSGLLGEDSHDPEADLAIFRKRYVATPTPPESIYPGIADLLTDLAAAGLRLAVCSNKPQHLCEKVLSELGIAGHFAVVMGSISALPAKPAPDMLDETLRQLGLAAESCVLVGDSEVDIALARTRGMDCLFVTYGYGNPDPLVPQDHRFTQAGDLRRVLLGQNAADGEANNGTLG